MSKCSMGGLHHPPLVLERAKFGGQRFVAVMITLEELPLVLGTHHLVPLAHRTSKHAPHERPPSKRDVLNAAVFVPYPDE